MKAIRYCFILCKEQRALEKAGFTREGVLRQAQWRSGGWHDQVMYSKLRGE
jgi:RimJ/RimL family protein N-acetyltransferase